MIVPNYCFDLTDVDNTDDLYECILILVSEKMASKFVLITPELFALYQNMGHAIAKMIPEAMKQLKLPVDAEKMENFVDGVIYGVTLLVKEPKKGDN